MDEPTNHLDIASKNVLKQALNKFDGTLILVSHDRDFLQGLATTVYGFKDKLIKEYLGDIDFFLEQHQIENLREAEKKTIIAKTPEISNKGEYKLSREEEKELKKLKNQLSKIETQIDILEKEISEMDISLVEDFEATSTKHNFFENYKAKKQKVEKLMEEWAEIEERTENCS
ncbi:MAG: ABC-F family ATP-binding cassette domain-containing protein [Lutibacter sp.]|nr:ABC-F family ATP-binding cassette domain-containing protein [Lutibacter sp.]